VLIGFVKIKLDSRLRGNDPAVAGRVSFHSLAFFVVKHRFFLLALKVEPIRKLLGGVVKKKILFDELRHSHIFNCRNEELFSFNGAVNFQAKVSEP